jgi:hypothetical protein
MIIYYVSCNYWEVEIERAFVSKEKAETYCKQLNRAWDEKDRYYLVFCLEVEE